jgi:hypothetical protein
MTLRGKGLEKVDMGYKGLGDSDEKDNESGDDDEGAPPLVLRQCEEVTDESYGKTL